MGVRNGMRRGKTMTGENRIRLLKIGVTRGDTFVNQAYFTTPSMVTVGRTPEAMVRLDHQDVPEHTALFSLEPESCMLQFKRNMRLAFLYDGLFRTPNYLIDEGLAFRRGRNYYMNLETRARGTLNFGPYRILFKLDFVDPPAEKVIPLPSMEALAGVACAHCGQTLDMLLPRPAVLSRCTKCRRYNRFEGQPLATSEAPPVRTTHTAGDAPVLLDKRVEGPPRRGGLVEDAMTILDAGVMAPPPPAPTPMVPPVAGEPSVEPSAETPAEPKVEPPAEPSSPPAPSVDLEPPAPHATMSPEEIAEKDTATMTRQLRAEKPQRARKRAVTGDHLRVVAAAEGRAEQAEEQWYAAGNSAAGAASAGGGKVVPLTVNAPAQRPAAGLSSAPHTAMHDAPAVGSVTDSYAAPKLADRLTMLVVALVIIAILLACILGVLLTQGAMRRLSAPPTEPADAPGLVAPADEPDGDV
jgi:hypothetical protein